MGLSRKREKELKRLRNDAADLWGDQRELLGHATGVAREAGRQLGNVSREQIAPRVRGAVDNHLAPAVSTSYQASKAVLDDARHRITHQVVPGVSGALTSAFASVEGATDPRLRELAHQLHSTSDKLGSNASRAFAAAQKNAAHAYGTVEKRLGHVKPQPKRSVGFGGAILIILGIAAVAGIAYAAYQTLRADDELWVLDESDTPETPEA